MEPKNQGYFQVDERTKIAIPYHVVDIEAWKTKMIDKYGPNRYKRIAQSLLTGAAKRKMKASL